MFFASIFGIHILLIFTVHNGILLMNTVCNLGVCLQAQEIAQFSSRFHTASDFAQESKISFFFWVFFSHCFLFIVFSNSSSSSCCSRATGHFLLAEIAPLKLYPRGFAVRQWKLICILIDFPQRRKTREQQQQGALATFRGCCGPTARACQYLHATHYLCAHTHTHSYTQPDILRHTH